MYTQKCIINELIVEKESKVLFYIVLRCKCTCTLACVGVLQVSWLGHAGTDDDDDDDDDDDHHDDDEEEETWLRHDWQTPV